MLKVSEIYGSLIPEGKHLLASTCFVRLPKDEQESHVDLSTDRFLFYVKGFPSVTFVSNGHDPLVYQDQLIDVTKFLHQQEIKVRVKTIGTHHPLREELRCVDYFSLQIDLSAYPKVLNVYSKTIPFFLKNNLDCEFVFAVSSPLFVHYVFEFVDTLGIPYSQIYLQPQATTRGNHLLIQEWLLPIAIAKGVKFTPNLEVLTVRGNCR